jgi:hypothetical protein
LIKYIIVVKLVYRTNMTDETKTFFEDTIDDSQKLFIDECIPETNQKDYFKLFKIFAPSKNSRYNNQKHCRHFEVSF